MLPPDRADSLLRSILCDMARRRRRLLWALAPAGLLMLLLPALFDWQGFAAGVALFYLINLRVYYGFARIAARGVAQVGALAAVTQQVARSRVWRVVGVE